MKYLVPNQYYYCHQCNDFYKERGMVFDSFITSLNNTFIGCTKYCDLGHLISSDNNNFIFLDNKPDRYINSCIISIDCKDFSELPDNTQFTIQSVLYQISKIETTINNKEILALLLFKGKIQA